MVPGSKDFWFLPLGGTGEIGMNFNLYGHDGAWLAVDCGITFVGQDAPPDEPHIQMADPGFIVQNRDLLTGLVITHAHEDHVGAVAYLWLLLRCPIYTTEFTGRVLQRKLGEAGLAGIVPVHIVPWQGRQTIGPFHVEWVALTHSIPEPAALIIDTPAARVFHTADWKLDPDPVVGEPYRSADYERVGELGIDAMVGDSTNAPLLGHSVSEGELAAGLMRAVSEANGRVVVSCFASNLARLVTLARVARDCGRQVSLFGRSLRQMVATARQQGLWPGDVILVPESHVGYLPRQATLVIATGSQGEERAALSRLARDRHPCLSLESGDRVVFSSRVIPGNEALVDKLVAALRARDVAIVQDGDYADPIHASGHPAQDELRRMYEWIRPAIAIPTHGEAIHMQAHATVAADAGVPRQMTGVNGDLFMVAPVPGIRRYAVATGRLGWDGEQLVSDW